MDWDFALLFMRYFAFAQYDWYVQLFILEESPIVFLQ